MIELQASGMDSTTVKRGCGDPTGIKQNIWDCLGDVMIEAMIGEKLGKPSEAGDEIVMKGWYFFQPKYYTTGSLLKISRELTLKGWKIQMEKDSAFYMECPKFGVWQERAGAQNYSASADRKIYAHPVDSNIIKFLDMPVIKSVFSSAVDMMTDLNFGQIISSGIAADKKSFPEIDGIVNRCASTLGIRKPYVVISGGVNMNAFTAGSDEEPYIILGNTLVKNMDSAKMSFIVGHECGHISMGHVLYHTIVNSASGFINMVPVVGPVLYRSAGFALAAWSRRSEITADRAGLLCCGDIDEACRALVQLQAGFVSAETIDVNSYVRNSKIYRRKGALKRAGEFFMTHPSLPKRIEALKLFAVSEPYYHARGLEPPKNSMTPEELNTAIEGILSVLGRE